MQLHQHYQVLIALAHGWNIEGSDDNKTWFRTGSPTIFRYARIVPDSNGWLPWYGGDKAPIDGKVDVIFRWKASSETISASGWSWNHYNLGVIENSRPDHHELQDIIKYRPHKEESVDPYAEPKAAAKDPTKQVRLKGDVWRDAGTISWGWTEPPSEYEIREKPTEPVYEYLWVIKGDDGRNFTSSYFYANEEEVELAVGKFVVLERCEWSKRPR